MTNEVVIKKRKKSLKMVGAAALLVCGITIITNAAVYAELKIVPKAYNMLDFEETTYQSNKEVSPGYYNNKPLVVSISNDFNRHYKQEIIKAIKYVDGVAEGLKFTIVEGSVEDADINIDVGYDIQVESTPGGKYVGLAYRKTGQIYINNKTIHTMGIKATVIHELGHILGLDHSKDITSLMYPLVSRKNFSEEDIENLNTIWPDQEDGLVR